MKIQKLSIALIATGVLAACSIANAGSKAQEQEKIYVYQGCKQIKEITMDESQKVAYSKFKQQEKKLAELEIPLNDMDEELAKYEQELEVLSDDIVIETEDKLVVNRAVVRKHEEIAEKMQQVVRARQGDIKELELHAKEIEAAAFQFEKVIRKSLQGFKGKDIQISIGKKRNIGRCEFSA
jgi:hypothetical protein